MKNPHGYQRGADDPNDDRMPAALDYQVRDRKVINLAALKIVLRIVDNLDIQGAEETRWRTETSAKILAGMTEFGRQLENETTEGEDEK